ncbi:MFS transporter [Campylobacter sp. MIT 99-7217]|uniref:MFS transporter n=1 Tax=Campylobacter sp. MIT 99-7217 TaxID=535091 RepID=UPI00115C3819|nr:MFS transporter [Campylobacter sp. MIT 99-7217]TQR32953.1 MFS transporter [Campylobacter sp. MIT 99-7217]
MNIKRTLRSLTALFVGMSFLFAGNALVVSSISIILKDMQASESTIGLINACFFLGGLISTLSAQKIIAKLGHIKAFGFFSALFGTCIILHIVNNNLYFWSLLRFILGFCYYSLLLVIESWLNEKAKNEIRSRVLSFYEIVFNISFGLGILIIALKLDNIMIFIIAASLIFFSSLPLKFIRIKRPVLPQIQPISLPKIFDIAPLATLTSFIGGMLMNGFFSMGALYILLQGYDEKAASYFMFFALFGGFLGQGIMGVISDKIGRKFAIIFASLTALFVMIIFLCFEVNLYVQYALAVLLGMGIFCLYALSLARANDMLEDKSKIVELGRGVLFCYSLGSLFSPILLGLLMQNLGAMGFALFYAICLTFLILFAINKPNVFKKRRFKENLRNLVAVDD